VESPASTELEELSGRSAGALELLESRLLEDCGLDSEEATLLEETSGFSLEEYCTFSLEEERSEPKVSESASLEEYASSA
jgi:hypothetical protein